MSPEQAQGRPADRRSDLWAFGCVLYEMLTGTRAFPGDDVTETLAAVIKTEPDWSRLPGDTAPSIRRLLARCLVKDARLRIADVSTARIEIADARDESPAAARPDPRARRATLVPWIVAAAAVVAAVAAGGAAYLSRRAADPRIIQLSAPFPEKTSLNPGALPAISPDGRRIAMALAIDGQQGLWVRDLASPTARLLPGTAGAVFPFWSPDNRTIGFFAEGKLKKIDAEGGPAQTLCEAANGRGGAWNADDVIVFAPAALSPLFRVAASGGERTRLTTTGADSRNPSFLPDGHHFLYTARNAEPDKAGVFVGDLNATSVARILADASNAVYSDLGYLLFIREQTLVAQRFDPSTLKMSGDVVPLAEHVDYFSGESEGLFAISPTRMGNPVLAYTSGWDEGKIQLTWFDRSGHPTGTLGSAAAILRRPRISDDGRAVVFEKFDVQSGGYDIWIHDLARGTDSRVTTVGRRNVFPVWAPDGASIAFSSTRDGMARLVRKAVSGVTGETFLDAAAGASFVRPSDWSRDGKYLVEETQQGSTRMQGDIWILPMIGGGKRFAYAATEFDERDGRLSPDGKWLAYTSDESKRTEVYVQSFPTPAGKILLSTAGGSRPVWSRDGRELFFMQADRTLMSVAVRGSATLDPGPAKPLFRMVGERYFDVGEDGRFLMPNETAQALAPPMTIVINWPSLLKKER
jgi:Tol biopolymer transport system component